MNFSFKWKVGDIVKMPWFNGELMEVKILERTFREDEHIAVIEYEIDMFTEGTIFTQEEIEKYN